MHTILAGRRKGARDQRGFTLVELLVVVLILGVLAAVVVFSVGGISTRGKNASCLTEVREVRTAIEAYKAQSATNVYPPTFATLWTPPTQLLESPITATSPSAAAGYVYGGPATGTYNVAAGKPGCPTG